MNTNSGRLTLLSGSQETKHDEQSNHFKLTRSDKDKTQGYKYTGSHWGLNKVIN